MAQGDIRYHHGDLKATTLREAIALINDGGVEAVTMRAIAKRIGVTHRALYRWYADHDALLAEIAAGAFEEMAEAIEAAIDGFAPDDAGKAFIHAYLRYALDHPALYRVAMSRDREAMRSLPQLRAAVDRLIFAARRAFPGEGDVVRDYVMALWSLLHGQLEIYHAGLPAIVGDDEFIRYAQTLSNLLQRPGLAPRS